MLLFFVSWKAPTVLTLSHHLTCQKSVSHLIDAMIMPLITIHLVGGLNIFYFTIYWECHHPNWLSYFSEGFKPPTRLPFTSAISGMSCSHSLGQVLESLEWIHTGRRHWPLCFASGVHSLGLWWHILVDCLVRWLVKDRNLKQKLMNSCVLQPVSVRCAPLYWNLMATFTHHTTEMWMIYTLIWHCNYPRVITHVYMLLTVLFFTVSIVGGLVYIYIYTYILYIYIYIHIYTLYKYRYKHKYRYKSCIWWLYIGAPFPTQQA